MVKTLIINSTLERSGLTNVIYNLVKYLDKNKFQVHILTLSPERKFSRFEDFINLGVTIHNLNLKGLGIYSLKSAQVKDKIKSIQPDIIHPFGFRGNVIAAKNCGNVPRMVTIQADLKENYVDDYGFILGSLMANYEINLAKSADCITVCSLELMKHYREIGKLELIQNGVCTETYFPMDLVRKNKMRIDFGLASADQVFVCTGLVNSRKDSLTVVKAFMMVNDLNKKLLMVGDGPLLEECKTIAKNHSSIIFTGKVSNVVDYLAASDFFISASKSEGMPNAVLEAGFVGLNLILSDIPPHKEISSQNGLGIHFFEPGNLSELYKLISNAKFEAIIMNPVYAAKTMAASFEEVYLKLTDRSMTQKYSQKKS